MTGPELREWRERHGLNLSAAASALNLPKSTFSQWENGSRRPSRLLPLAIAFLEILAMHPNLDSKGKSHD